MDIALLAAIAGAVSCSFVAAIILAVMCALD
jgi:hypothetical protein